MLLTKEELKALINGVWTGRYDQTKLPAWLFAKLANGYEGAAVKGWGNDLGAGAIKDLNLEKSLQENIYYFAAHKTAQELKVLHGLYQAAPNKYSFAKEAMKMNENWNWHWYNTEYNVTTRMARAGREWLRIDASKGYYPKLMFIAVQDANTRAEHAALNGTIRPVDDPFWKTYFPPLSWNCRCRTERLQTGANTNLSQVNKPPVIEQFQQKVTDSKKIWADNHPYFHGLEAPALKAVKELVVQKVALNKVKKIAVEKPYEFETPEILKAYLEKEHPGVEFDISINKFQYDGQIKGFDFPRFIKNFKQDLLDTDEMKIINDANGDYLKSEFVKKSPSKLRKIKLNFNYGEIDMEGYADNEYGEVYLHRQFKNRHGFKMVEHNYLMLPEEIQGGGFSKTLFQHLYTEYQACGIELIKVHANINVGGYTWARYGFSQDLTEVLSWLRNKNNYGGLADDLYKEAVKIVQTWEKSAPGELFPMNKLAELKGMKKPMLGSNWYGEINLKTNPVQKKVFEDYLLGAKKK